MTYEMKKILLLILSVSFLCILPFEASAQYVRNPEAASDPSVSSLNYEFAQTMAKYELLLKRNNAAIITTISGVGGIIVGGVVVGISENVRTQSYTPEGVTIKTGNEVGIGIGAALIFTGAIAELTGLVMLTTTSIKLNNVRLELAATGAKLMF